MILAHIPNVTREIPRTVRRSARIPEIEVYGNDIPYGADTWIYCPSAWPHTDPVFGGKIFLTLSVKSRHMAGDALAPEPLNDVPPGRLFVIDPLVAHWLAPNFNLERRVGWIGVQWEVEVHQAQAKAREIVASLNGTWLAHTLKDTRYISW